METWLISVLQGVLGKIFYATGLTWLRSLLGSNICITSPKPDHYLEEDPKPFGGRITYKVTETLKYLPEDHSIWLLRQPDGDECFFPQGFC